jgi:hypothetical protein
MGVIIGFIIGYIVGTKSSPVDYEEIRRAWDEIKSSKEAQALVAGSADIALQTIQQSLGILGKVATKR